MDTLLVDTQGLLMQAIVHAADIQDRDGGVLLMSSLLGLFPFLLKLYADSGYQGPKFQQGLGKRQRDTAVLGVGSGPAVWDGAHRHGSRASIWRIG